MSKQNLHYVHLKCWIWLTRLCLCAVKIDFLLFFLCFMFAFPNYSYEISRDVYDGRDFASCGVHHCSNTQSRFLWMKSYFCWRQRKRDGARLFGKSTIISLKLTDDSSWLCCLIQVWSQSFDQTHLVKSFWSILVEVLVFEGSKTWCPTLLMNHLFWMWKFRDLPGIRWDWFRLPRLKPLWSFPRRGESVFASHENPEGLNIISGWVGFIFLFLLVYVLINASQFWITHIYIYRL